MAESDSGEKTEEATPEKLRKAKERGQVAKSRDAVQALIFIGAIGVLFLSFGYIGEQLKKLIVDCFTSISHDQVKGTMLSALNRSFYTLLLCCVPIALTVSILGALGNYFQMGFIFTTEQMKLDFNKINPINGLKQMFSMNKLVELLKQVAKFSIVAYVIYYCFKSNLRDVMLMERMDLAYSVTVGYQILKKICIYVGLATVVIAAVDFFWQRYSFAKKMRMSHYEVKQEYKQSEGDPHLKGERKRLAQELIMHGNTQRAAKADAIVTNPAHIAIAIQYEGHKNGAPIVVAKGMRKVAEEIKKIARQYHVPILRNVPLAAALNKLEVEEEIPEELYEAVAEVLNFVYELKKQGKT